MEPREESSPALRRESSSPRFTLRAPPFLGKKRPPPLGVRPSRKSPRVRSWSAAVHRRQEESAHCVEFIPFSLEAGGVWGLAAKRFFKRCVARADNLDRDVDLYHWSSAKFESTWRDTLSGTAPRRRAAARPAALSSASPTPRRSQLDTG